jgi:uncharacterized membrane protein
MTEHHFTIIAGILVLASAGLTIWVIWVLLH